jgi:hypothetical protein
MSKNPGTDLPPDKVALYRAVVETQPDVELKGAKNAYTSLNGNMYSFMTADGQLAVRLPEARRAEFTEEHGTGPCIQYGAVMRGYALLPDDMLTDLDAASAMFAESLAFAKTLKPKPTTRSKPNAAKTKSRARSKPAGRKPPNH